MSGEDPQHVAWIKTKPCELCGVALGVQAYAVHDEGKGQRPHDHWKIPLCQPCLEMRADYRGFFEIRNTGHWPRDLHDLHAWEQGKAAHYRWLHVTELSRGLLPY